ncbi:MAG TPA: TonB-dependent receptor [Sphingomicrobium sp.]
MYPTSTHATICLRNHLRHGASLCSLIAALAVAGMPQLAHAQSSVVAGGQAEAAAQTNPVPQSGGLDGPAEAGQGEIVVTGSRIAGGSNAPTPVTIVSSEALQRGNPSTPVAALRDLPALSATATSTRNPASGGASNGGASFLDLRGLGANRTLTLVNGRRFVPATSTGLVDANLIPSALLERIDLVTGGGSAAYGSDAVAGVVNFVLNTKLEGVRAKAQLGISQYGDNAEKLFTVALGQAFLDGRLHVSAGGEYYRNEGVGPAARDWSRRGFNIINNPTGTPAQVLAPNSRIRATTGGYVVAGNGGTAAANAAFTGLTFGPGGTVGAYDFGTLTTSGTQSGGSGFDTTTTQPLNRANNRKTAYGHIDFEVADGWEIFGEGSYGEVKATYVNGPNLHLGATNLTIQRDNAYLPAAVRAQMIASGVTSLTVSRVDAEDGYLLSRNTERVARGIGGIRGQVGTWNVDAFFSYGDAKAANAVSANYILANYGRAVDAVTAGNGQIVCRSTLAAPTDGCVPFNIFGQGSPSAAAVSYVTGTAVARTHNTLKNTGINASGTLFEGWAGPIKAAAGLEARWETSAVTSDALSQQRAFNIQNVIPWAAKQDVQEGYLEASIPLLRDLPFARELSVDVAGRRTHYSTSGSVNTWKVSGSWTPVRDLRFRATRSRDIRAPSLSELFVAGTQDVFNGTDPVRGNTQVFRVLQLTSGNPSLQPEKSNTQTYGVIFQPTFIPRFTLSVDYYDIKIKGAIASLTSQNLLNQCFVGVTTACTNFVRDSGGNLTTVLLRPINYAGFQTRGVDIDLNYTIPFAGSDTLNIRSITNRLITQKLSNPGSASQEQAGDVGLFANPKWRNTTQATYNNGGFTGFLQSRYIGGGIVDSVRAAAGTLLNQEVKGRLYLDGQLSYRLQSAPVEFYLNIRNLLDKDPPVFPSGSTSNPAQTNGSLFDMVGRMFSVGVNVRI